MLNVKYDLKFKVHAQNELNKVSLRLQEFVYNKLEEMKNNNIKIKNKTGMSAKFEKFKEEVYLFGEEIQKDIKPFIKGHHNNLRIWFNTEYDLILNFDICFNGWINGEEKNAYCSYEKEYKYICDYKEGFIRDFYPQEKELKLYKYSEVKKIKDKINKHEENIKVLKDKLPYKMRNL